MEIKKVLIIFKTHLDIGFTDFADVVMQKYFDVFIPNALKTAQELKERNADASFKWTTGSWLISEYLREYDGSEKAEALRRAIRSGADGALVGTAIWKAEDPYAFYRLLSGAEAGS